MKIIRQLGVILLITLIAEILNRLIPLPIPAGIHGLLLLFLLLCLKIVRPAHISDVADFLIGNMPILFVPAAVGILVVWSDLQAILAPFLVISVVSTLVVMAVTGGVAELMLRHGKGKDEHDE